MHTVTRCVHCGSLDFDGLVIDRQRGRIGYGERWAHAQPKILDVAERLMQASGASITTDRFIVVLWGASPNGEPEFAENNVKVYIHRLRKALAAIAAPIAIDTIYGGGYRLVTRRAASPPESHDQQLPGAASEATV